MIAHKKKSGTPRDLPSIQAHIERMEAWSKELYEACDLDLRMCDGNARTGQSGLLSDIRNDARAILSELRARGK